jgi:hypothetical protein
MVQSALGMDESGPVEIWSEGPKFDPPTYTAPEKKDRGDKICSELKVFFKYANGIVLEPGTDPKPPGFGAIFISDTVNFRLDRGRCESDPEEVAIDLMSKRPRDFTPAARRRHRDRPSLGDGLPSGQHRALDGTQAALGPGQGRIHRQQRRQPIPRPRTTPAVDVARRDLTRIPP